MVESLVLVFESPNEMLELVEMLLELMVERPMVGIATLTLAASVICFILTGSIVPIVCGLLISLWGHWRISRRRVITLGLSDRTAPSRRRDQCLHGLRGGSSTISAHAIQVAV
jgi:hypothetical protein